MARPKGSKSKFTNELKFDLLATLRAKKFDPLAQMIHTHQEALKQYKKRAAAGGTGFGGVGYLQIARECESDMLQYIYPKLKNVEMTGKDGQDFFQSFTQMIKNVVDGKEKPDADPT